jgi:ABC-2 type transport system permease protein
VKPRAPQAAGAALAAALLVVAFLLPGGARRWLAPLAVIALGAGLVYALGGGRSVLRIGNAMMRRNWLTMVSYRMQIVAFAVYVALGLALIWLVGKPVLDALVGPAQLLHGAGLPPDAALLLIVGVVSWPLFWRSCEVTANGVRQEQWSGTFESIVPTPDGVRALPFCYLYSNVGVSILSQAAILVLLGFALPAGSLHLVDPALALNFLAVTFVCMLCMWGLGLLFGGLAVLYKQLGPADAVVKLLFIALAGIFVPLQLLPGWMQAASRAIPVTYALDLLRGIAVDGRGIADQPVAFAILVGFTVATVVAGNLAYRALVDRARRQGAIQGY